MTTIIGITGGVGCGKSSVVDYIQKNYDCAVMKTDKVSHFGMKKGNPTYEPILEILSTIILDEDGEINRSKMARIIFNDPDKLEAINDIVFPYVQRVIEEHIDLARRAGIKYFIIESALMFHEKCDLYGLCDDVWYIFTQENLRYKRLTTNRNYSIEKSRTIMLNQYPESTFEMLSNVVIDNSGPFGETVKQIKEYLD